MVNKTNWTEDNYVRLFEQNCTIGLLIENTGPYNSFARLNLDIFIRPTVSGQIGLQVNTSAYVYHSFIRVTGNVTTAGAIGINGNYTGVYGGFVACFFDICFETNSASGIPLQLGTDFEWQGTGVVDTTQGSVATSTVTTNGEVEFNGWWDVPGFNPGAGIWMNNATNSATVAGVLTLNAGTNTAAGAAATSPSFVSGTALQVNTASDSVLYVEVTTAAALAIAIGPTSTPANPIVSSITAALGLLTIRVPAGWYMK